MIRETSDSNRRALGSWLVFGMPAASRPFALLGRTPQVVGVRGNSEPQPVMFSPSIFPMDSQGGPRRSAIHDHRVNARKRHANWNFYQLAPQKQWIHQKQAQAAGLSLRSICPRPGLPRAAILRHHARSLHNGSRRSRMPARRRLSCPFDYAGFHLRSFRSPGTGKRRAATFRQSSRAQRGRLETRKARA